ncbi:MAG: hypothetical protein GXP38_16185 [Chloroflexi bacterium]|nr:hypothetical protein [Chloroflexota bacterium]
MNLHQRKNVQWLFVALILTITFLVWLFFLTPAIVIRWQTETEADTVAFNILRAEVGSNDFQPINSQPIPAHGSIIQGATYAFTDKSVHRGRTYIYRLQEITVYGEQITYDNDTEAHAQRSPAEIIAAATFLLLVWGRWLLLVYHQPYSYSQYSSPRLPE